MRVSNCNQVCPYVWQCVFGCVYMPLFRCNCSSFAQLLDKTITDSKVRALLLGAALCYHEIIVMLHTK